MSTSNFTPDTCGKRPAVAGSADTAWVRAASSTRPGQLQLHDDVAERVHRQQQAARQRARPGRCGRRESPPRSPGPRPPGRSREWRRRTRFPMLVSLARRRSSSASRSTVLVGHRRRRAPGRAGLRSRRRSWRRRGSSGRPGPIGISSKCRSRLAPRLSRSMRATKRASLPALLMSVRFRDHRDGVVLVAADHDVDAGKAIDQLLVLGDGEVGDARPRHPPSPRSSTFRYCGGGLERIGRHDARAAARIPSARWC